MHPTLDERCQRGADKYVASDLLSHRVRSKTCLQRHASTSPPTVSATARQRDRGASGPGRPVRTAAALPQAARRSCRGRTGSCRRYPRGGRVEFQRGDSKRFTDHPFSKARREGKKAYLRKQTQLSPSPFAEMARITSSFVRAPSICKRAPSGISVRQPFPTSSGKVSFSQASTARAMALASSGPSINSQSSPSTMRSKARRNCSNVCQLSSSFRTPRDLAYGRRANLNKSR